MSEDLRAIKIEIGQAEQNFDYADPEHVDAAIYQMKAAEERASALLIERKDH